MKCLADGFVLNFYEENIDLHENGLRVSYVCCFVYKKKPEKGQIALEIKKKLKI